MTLRETFHNIRTDHEAHRTFMQMKPGIATTLFLFFNPATVAITLYRFSHWFYMKRMRPIAWIIWQFNIYVTGADILPASQIGPYFYIGHATGIVLTARIGAHVKVFGQACIGGGVGNAEDVGAGPGLPVIGDHVSVGFRSLILGALTIGDHATIGPMTFVNKSVPAGATAVGNPCRILANKLTDAQEPAS